MGVLESLNEFAGGAAVGVGQGMDLYQQYSDIQEQGAKRRKKQLLEEFISKTAQEGGFKDQAAGLKAVSDYALEIGDTDSYTQFYDTSEKLRKASRDRKVMQAYSVLQGPNPSAALPIVNEFFKSAGVDIEYGKGADNQFFMRQGKEITPLQVEDEDEFRGAILSGISPYFFDDPGEAMEFELDQNLKTAQAGKFQADAVDALEQARLRGPETAAKIARDNAAANADNVRAGTELARANAQIYADTTRGDANIAAAEASRAGVISGMLPPDETRLPNETIPFAERPDLNMGVSSALQKANAGTTISEAGSYARSILSDMEAGKGIIYNENTGEVLVAGEPKKLPRQVVALIQREFSKYGEQ